MHVMRKFVLPVLAALSISGGACSDVQSAQVADLKNQIAKRDKTIEALKTDILKEKAHVAAFQEVEKQALTARQPVSSTSQADPPPRKAPVSMCYKDYCPCDQPQEGMDSILCDQLEEGLDVPIESMIAGRGGREARRQMSELGY